MRTPAAELHVHTYGAIEPADFLEHIASRTIAGEVDWGLFQRSYAEAYGVEANLTELVRRHAAGDPRAALEFSRLFVFGDRDAGDFGRFQAKFNLVINGTRLFDHIRNGAPLGGAVDEFGAFIGEITRGQRAQGLGYAETRMLLARMPIDSCAPFYRGALDHVARACDEGFSARLAVSLPRDDPWPQWRVVKQLACESGGAVLSGIDFCAFEEGFPPSGVATLFDEVRAFNHAHPERALAILYHVGESFGDKSLESAIRWVQEAAELGAHRLGHAIALGVDPDLYGDHMRSESASERRAQIAYDLAHADGLHVFGVEVDRSALRREAQELARAPTEARVEHRYDGTRRQEVRARQGYAIARVKAAGSVVEVCPTSNRRIGGISDARFHPIHRFVREALPFVVASDDPGTFATTLAHELEWVAEQVGSDVAQAAQQRAWHARSEVLVGRTVFGA